MKNLLRSLLVATTLSLALSSTVRATAAETGEFDLGQFTPAKNGQHVQINLSAGLLQFAAKIAAIKEPEAASLLGNLRRIRVQVVSIDEENRAQTVAQVGEIRSRLSQEGWSQVVSVREKEGGDDVAVYLKQNADESIAGIVVTVLDGKGEAVCINIVGHITAEQLGQVAEKLDIDPLRKVHAKLESKGV